MSEQQPQNLEPHVKEYMDSQNPTAYNTGAIESISAMPKDEKGLPIPNETAYNNSQVILEGDSEAMGRSLEMERWSEKAGEHAEKASGLQQEQSLGDLKMGKTKEQIQRNARRVSEIIANNGVQASFGRRIHAKEGGIMTTDPYSEKFDRSPASIRLSREEIKENEEIKKEAIRKAKEII